MRPVVDAGIVAALGSATNVTGFNARQIAGRASVFVQWTTAGSGSSQWFELEQPFFTANPATGAKNVTEGGATT